MKSRLVSAGVAGLMLALVGSANAEVQTFAREGSWQAYGGTSDNGRALCGVSSSGTGKYFGLKYFNGDNTLTIQLGSNEWRVKDGAKQRVRMQIDNNSQWDAVGTAFHFGDGDAGLEFEIRSNQLETFMTEFRGGNTLFIRFPETDVSDWRASLDGSDTISDSFVRCVKALRS